MVSLGQKLKMPKTCEKPFYKNSTLVLCKKRLQKAPNIGKKKDNFENRPSTNGYSPCKGYRLCKMVSLGQNLQMPRTCEKPFYNTSAVVLCKKTARKNTKYWKKKTILKIGHLAKAIAHAKAIAFAKWSNWVKNYKCQKHAKNHSTRSAELFCAKNASKKHQILEKKRTILKIDHLPKAIAHAKAIAFAKWSAWVKN